MTTSVPTPEQDKQNTIIERVGIIVIAVAAIGGVFTLIMMGKATAEFTTWLMLFIPVIGGMLFVHNGVRQVVKQTNGQFTTRLNNQTADVINGVTSVLDKGTRPESEYVSKRVSVAVVDDEV